MDGISKIKKKFKQAKLDIRMFMKKASDTSESASGTEINPDKDKLETFSSNPISSDAQSSLHVIENSDSNLSNLTNSDCPSNFSSQQDNSESIFNNFNNSDSQSSHSEKQNESESISNCSKVLHTQCNLFCCMVDNLNFSVRLSFSKNETVRIYGSGSNARERSFNKKLLKKFSV